MTPRRRRRCPRARAARRAPRSAPRAATRRAVASARVTRAKASLGKRWSTRFAPTCHVPLGLLHELLSKSVRPESPRTRTLSPSGAPPPPISSDSAKRLARVSTSPAPEQSMRSTIFGVPSVVSWRPAASGSTPVSKMAMTTPRPSNRGCALMRGQQRRAKHTGHTPPLAPRTAPAQTNCTPPKLFT